MDNGVSIAKETKYNIVTDLGSRVSRYNKPWNASADKDQQE